jgi:hypothetical protein
MADRQELRQELSSALVELAQAAKKATGEGIKPEDARTYAAAARDIAEAMVALGLKAPPG